MPSPFLGAEEAYALGSQMPDKYDRSLDQMNRNADQKIQRLALLGEENARHSREMWDKATQAFTTGKQQYDQSYDRSYKEKMDEANSGRENARLGMETERQGWDRELQPGRVENQRTGNQLSAAQMEAAQRQNRTAGSEESYNNELVNGAPRWQIERGEDRTMKRKMDEKQLASMSDTIGANRRAQESHELAMADARVAKAAETFAAAGQDEAKKAQLRARYSSGKDALTPDDIARAEMKAGRMLGDAAQAKDVIESQKPGAQDAIAKASEVNAKAQALGTLAMDANSYVDATPGSQEEDAALEKVNQTLSAMGRGSDVAVIKDRFTMTGTRSTRIANVMKQTRADLQFELDTLKSQAGAYPTQALQQQIRAIEAQLQGVDRVLPKIQKNGVALVGGAQGGTGGANAQFINGAGRGAPGGQPQLIPAGAPPGGPGGGPVAPRPSMRQNMQHPQRPATGVPIR